MLNAPDWRTRSQAVSRLNQLPVSKLPTAAADRLIDLLIKAELSPPPESERKGEGFGDYELALHRAVLRLEDARSVRALALNGVEMSGEAQDFVASFAGEALPHLDEAWEVLDPASRYGVVDTWARMLARYSEKLTHREEPQVRERIFQAFENRGLFSSGVRAVRTADLTGAVPVLRALADTASSSLLSDAASDAQQSLASDRQSLSLPALAADLATWLDAFCLEPEPGPKFGACKSLENRLSTARRHIEAGRDGPARNVLQSFIDKADQAHGQDAFTDSERTLLVGSAEALIGRLVDDAGKGGTPDGPGGGPPGGGGPAVG